MLIFTISNTRNFHYIQHSNLWKMWLKSPTISLLLGPSSGMRSSCGAGAWLGAFKAWRSAVSKPWGKPRQVMEDMGKIWKKYGKMLGLSTLEAFFHIFPYFFPLWFNLGTQNKWELGGFYHMIWSNESALADWNGKNWVCPTEAWWNQQENQVFEKQKVIWRKQQWFDH